MSKENWVWMPHPAHFICSKHCQFILSTYVNGYIISTVGEMIFPSDVNRILKRDDHEILKLQGDNFDREYFKKYGYKEIGYGRLYETMVFVAKESCKGCCPYVAKNWSEINFEGYEDSDSAMKGHYAMCEKYDKRPFGEDNENN